MSRRFLLAIFQRSVALFLLVCLGCSAQLAPDVNKKIERQVRSFYNLPAEVQVSMSAPKPSEFPGYDLITVTLNNTEKKQDVNFLLSKDGKTLVRFTKMDLSKDPYQEVMSKIDTKGRPTRGNKDAKVVAVNYDDFECPFCSRMHQELFPTIFNEYHDRVLFVYKDFPLTDIHPWAVHAAVNANCLASQNNDAFWDFADYMHANQHSINSVQGMPGRLALLDKITLDQGQKRNLDMTKLQACVKAQDDSAVKASMHEADMLGISATPTLFVNGEKVDGALPLTELRAVFDRALKDAGVPPPAKSPAAASGAPSGK
jgi:protein-disulfide isomerase